MLNAAAAWPSPKAEGVAKSLPPFSRHELPFSRPEPLVPRNPAVPPFIAVPCHMAAAGGRARGVLHSATANWPRQVEDAKKKAKKRQFLQQSLGLRGFFKQPGALPAVPRTRVAFR